MTIDTILFDLDGTLLPMDFDAFMASYFHHMGQHFEEHIDPDVLRRAVMEATMKMITTNDDRTNYDIFMDHFETLIDGDLAFYQEHFTRYYETLFHEVKDTTWVSEAMVDAVGILKQKGYRLVIATNPLFPLAANLHRIRWAGLDPADFDLITSLEDNRYTKPNPAFYHEVLTTLGTTPDRCLMVGNDVDDDLPAKQAGIATYLITDCLLHASRRPYEADYISDSEQFRTFVQTLPSLV
jgi:HAD superfamily hydrolase (TIGR01549 family)